MTDKPTTDGSSNVDLLEQWFGSDRLRRDLQTVESFWDGKGRYVVSVNSSQHGYRQLRDPSQAPELAVKQLQHQAGLPGLNLPAFYPDLGTISVPRYWGGSVHWPEDGNIFIEPVAACLDDALKLRPKSVDDPSMDARRALDLFRQTRRLLGTRYLWHRTVDMQGPLNTAALICDQQELLSAMYEDPEKVESLVQGITDFFIELAEYQYRSVDGQLAGSIWPYAFFPARRGIAFTEDMMPLLSTELYARFGLPYLKRIQEARGAMMIHCCGDWGRHARTLADAGLNIAAVEFHYPFTTIEQLAPLADRCVFIPYITLNKQTRFSSVGDYYRHLLDSTPSSTRFWFAWSEDSEQALAFAQEFGPTG